MSQDLSVIKELREATGAGVLDVKEALSEAGGDKDKALKLLRDRGQKVAAKKADREAGEGIVDAYIHAGGKVAGVVVLACETDFVAKTDEFKALAHDISMHIAAAAPQYLTEEEVPAEAIENEKKSTASS